MTNAEREELHRVLDAMRGASDTFYLQAVRIGNHPFIEFAGLMNEYISCCRDAVERGIDFRMCSTHTQGELPMKDYQVAYVNEKLECIFTGRSVMKGSGGRAT